MKKGLMVMGMLSVLVFSALIGFISAEEKSIDNTEFSLGRKTNYVNISTPTVTVEAGDSNSDVNLFVFNNATYDSIVFEVSPSPADDGSLPSSVEIDVGNNGKVDYSFSGYGVGDWGNQGNFMNEKMTTMTSVELFPNEEGDIYYLKLPSDADVYNASINLTHPTGVMSLEARIPSSQEWGRSYMYEYYYYGYGYFFPKGNAGSYCMGNLYPRATDYRYESGYPSERGYLKWSLDDEKTNPPAGADITNYKLRWLPRIYRRSGTFPGYSDRYHHGERTYALHELTEKMPGYTRTPYIYYNPSYLYSRYNSMCPSYESTSIGQHTVSYHGSSSSYYYYPGSVYDLKDTYDDWLDDPSSYHGVVMRVPSTQVDSSEPHNSGYSRYSGRTNYKYYYQYGYFYSPGASSSYNPGKPVLLIDYTLDSKNLWVDVLDDGVKEFTNPGCLNGTTYFSGWQAPINNYLRSHFPDEVDRFGNEFTYVPFSVGASTSAKVILSEIKIEYNDKRVVQYNPSTGDLLNDFRTSVPSIEEGWSLIPINVSSATKGNITFSNLKLVGDKPNYRPSAASQSVLDGAIQGLLDEGRLYEGVVDPMLLPLSDFVFDVDDDPTEMIYRVMSNDQDDHLDLTINRFGGRAGSVYLGIDTSEDINWFGSVNVEIAAVDSGGKDIRLSFELPIPSVNDLPYLKEGFELPELQAEEGLDKMLIEFLNLAGREVASGKISLLIGENGYPYFEDIEDDMIHLDFALVGPEGGIEPDRSDLTGFKLFYGEGQACHLYVLPPESTDDPDNYILIFGSGEDFFAEEGKYSIRIYASDDPEDLKGQTFMDVPIEITSVDDPPQIARIPDILMEEDTTYRSSFAGFRALYLTDVDTPLEELDISFTPKIDGVLVFLDEEERLSVYLEPNIDGIVPVVMKVSDETTEVTTTFNVRIQSENDPPTVEVSNLYDGIVIDDLYFIRGTADDIEKNLRSVEIGLSTIGIEIDDEDWVEADGAFVWQHMLDIRNYKEGDYTIWIRSYDGRDYSPVETFDIRIEKPQPTVKDNIPRIFIVTTLEGPQEDTLLIEGTAEDISNYIEKVEYRIDGGIWYSAAYDGKTGDWDLTVNTRELKNIRHNISVRAYNGKLFSVIRYIEFDVFNEDSDLGGIPNEKEEQYMMDPFNPLDDVMDFDKDGYSNVDEINANTDPFDGNSHPAEDEKGLVESWVLLFIIMVIISAILIIGLFITNVKMDSEIVKWKEDLYHRRAERRPKTLLQKIVEIAPSFSVPFVHTGPTLPSGAVMDEKQALPPMEGEQEQPPQV